MDLRLSTAARGEEEEGKRTRTARREEGGTGTHCAWSSWRWPSCPRVRVQLVRDEEEVSELRAGGEGGRQGQDVRTEGGRESCRRTGSLLRGSRGEVVAGERGREAEQPRRARPARPRRCQNRAGSSRSAPAGWAARPKQNEALIRACASCPARRELSASWEVEEGACAFDISPGRRSRRRRSLLATGWIPRARIALEFALSTKRIGGGTQGTANDATKGTARRLYSVQTVLVWPIF